MMPSMIVGQFEAGTLAADDFDHAAHLYLAAHCVLTLPRATALDGVRRRLQAFLRRQGVKTTRERGYHETLTRFWFERVAEVVHAHPGLELDALAPILRAQLGDKRLALRAYSRDRIMSWAARTGWLPPETAPASVNRGSQGTMRIAG